MRRLPLTRCSICGLSLILLFLVGCHIQSGNYIEDHVQDSKSRTLNFLLNDTDVPGDWKWLDVITYQRYVTPTSENSYSSEIVTRTLKGLYKSNEYRIEIHHRIEKYDQQPIVVPTLQYPADGVPDFFQLNQLETVANLNYLCTDLVQQSRTDATVCNLVVKYESMNSILFIYVPSGLDKDDLGTIIYSSVQAIDKHIQSNK